MECKGSLICERLLQIFVLIETSWNVKVYISDTTHETLPVLIETSWNVKELKATVTLTQGAVLIETSWNVKSAL